MANGAIEIMHVPAAGDRPEAAELGRLIPARLLRAVLRPALLLRIGSGVEASTR
jgi:hypothetical protein